MTTIVVHNLHPSVTIQDLTQLFDEFGELLGVHIYNRETNKKSAQLTYKNYDDALNAIEMLEGKYLDGRRISLHFLPRKQY